MKKIIDKILKALKIRKKCVLFVCTGNTCRSPMAEMLFNKYARSGWVAISAGTMVAKQKGMTPEAQESVVILGVDRDDCVNHRARQVSEDLLDKVDKVFCLTQTHLSRLNREFPGYTHKCDTLKKEDIQDPFGKNVLAYRLCSLEISRAIRQLKL